MNARSKTLIENVKNSLTTLSKLAFVFASLKESKLDPTLPEALNHLKEQEKELLQDKELFKHWQLILIKTVARLEYGDINALVFSTNILTAINSFDKSLLETQTIKVGIITAIKIILDRIQKLDEKQLPISTQLLINLNQLDKILAKNTDLLSEINENFLKIEFAIRDASFAAVPDKLNIIYSILTHLPLFKENKAQLEKFDTAINLNISRMVDDRIKYSNYLFGNISEDEYWHIIAPFEKIYLTLESPENALKNESHPIHEKRAYVFNVSTHTLTYTDCFGKTLPLSINKAELSEILHQIHEKETFANYDPTLNIKAQTEFKKYARQFSALIACNNPHHLSQGNASSVRDFNELSLFIQLDILSKGTLQDLIIRFDFWVVFLEQMIKMQDLHSASAISAALEHFSLQYLFSELEKMSDVVSPHGPQPAFERFQELTAGTHSRKDAIRADLVKTSAFIPVLEKNLDAIPNLDMLKRILTGLAENDPNAKNAEFLKQQYQNYVKLLNDLRKNKKRIGALSQNIWLDLEAANLELLKQLLSKEDLKKDRYGNETVTKAEAKLFKQFIAGEIHTLDGIDNTHFQQVIDNLLHRLATNIVPTSQSLLKKYNKVHSKTSQLDGGNQLLLELSRILKDAQDAAEKLAVIRKYSSLLRHKKEKLSNVQRTNTFDVTHNPVFRPRSEKPGAKKVPLSRTRKSSSADQIGSLFLQRQNSGESSSSSYQETSLSFTGNKSKHLAVREEHVIPANKEREVILANSNKSNSDFLPKGSKPAPDLFIYKHKNKFKGTAAPHNSEENEYDPDFSQSSFFSVNSNANDSVVSKEDLTRGYSQTSITSTQTEKPQGIMTEEALKRLKEKREMFLKNRFFTCTKIEKKGTEWHLTPRRKENANPKHKSIGETSSSSYEKIEAKKHHLSYEDSSNFSLSKKK